MTKERIAELYRLVNGREPPEDYSPTAREIAWLDEQAGLELEMRKREKYE